MTPQAAQAPPQEGILVQLKALWSEALGLLAQQLELAALEAREAFMRLAAVMVLALAGAALAVAAWLTLAAAGVAFLVSQGFSPVGALLLAFLVNVGGVGLCLVLLRREWQGLPFAATLRSLRR